MLREQRFHILWLSIASACGTLALAASARAEREAIRIEYRAERGCSSQDQFAQRVLRLARSARLANETERARTFTVTIERRADKRQGDRRFSGSLVVQDAGRSTVARTVTGKSCAEVAEVLALATALAVDPTATRVEPEPSTAAAAPGTNDPAPDGPSQPSDRPDSRTPRAAPNRERAPSSASARNRTRARRENASQSAREKPDDSATEPVEDEYADTPYADQPDAPSSPLAQSFALLAGPGVKLGASPRLAAGASVTFEIQPAHSAALLHSAGVEFALMRSFSERVESASVTFDLAFVRPRLCLRLVQPLPTLRLASCLGAELGLLIARGEDLPNPRTEQRAWAAVEASLRLELDLTKRWLVSFDTAGSVPFTRDSFFFEDPRTPIYEVPPLGFAAGVKLGVRL